MTKNTLILMTGLIIAHNASAQFTMTFSTAAPGGKYAQRNVVAAWIETEGGTFVKTISRYGNVEANDMSFWRVVSGGKSVDTDAVMGATRSNHSAPPAISATWDLKDRNGNDMPDGNYKIWFNIDDGSEKNYSFSFIKDQNAGTRTDPGNSYFKNISIAYDPPPPPNTAPVAQGQSVLVGDGNPKSITLSATDAEGDPVTYNILSQPASGQLLGMPPELIYVPVKGMEGTISFTFNATDGLLTGNTATVSMRLLINDSDSNGMPDSWQSTYGVTNSAADPDKDGASNYNEYMAGTDPTNSDSVFAVHPMQWGGESNVTLQWNSTQYNYYSIQSSTNLSGGWDTLNSNTAATPPVNSYTGTVHSTVPTFFRIGLEP